MRNFWNILIILSFIPVGLYANIGLDAEKWEKTIKDLDYTENFKEYKPKNRKTKAFNPSQWKTGKNAAIFKALVIIILGIILLVLIIFLIKNLSKIDFTRKVSGRMEIEEEDDPDKYVLSDLEHYLNEALATRNYRLALRINFLMLIKSLKEQELIIWKKDKTNSDYLFEIKEKPYHGNTKKLMHAFEKVWYANYKIEEQTYQKLSFTFETVRKEIYQ